MRLKTVKRKKGGDLQKTKNVRSPRERQDIVCKIIDDKIRDVGRPEPWLRPTLKRHILRVKKWGQKEQ